MTSNVIDFFDFVDDIASLNSNQVSHLLGISKYRLARLVKVEPRLAPYRKNSRVIRWTPSQVKEYLNSPAKPVTSREF
jgi:hypothetical protein